MGCETSKDSNENHLNYNESYICYCYIYQAEKKSLEIVGDDSLWAFESHKIDLTCVQIASLKKDTSLKGIGLTFPEI